jgi:hypothetical protein
VNGLENRNDPLDRFFRLTVLCTVWREDENGPAAGVILADPPTPTREQRRDRLNLDRTLP